MQSSGLRNSNLYRLRAAGTATASRSSTTPVATASEFSAETATILEAAARDALVHGSAAAIVASEAAASEAWVVVLGVALHDVKTLAADFERAGCDGGLEGLWAAEVDKGAILGALLVMRL
jgi:hypothetical protein